MISVTKLDISVTVETFGSSGRHLESSLKQILTLENVYADTDHPQTEKSVYNMLRIPVLAYTRRVIFIHAICLPHYKSQLAVADSTKWDFCTYVSG